MYIVVEMNQNIGQAHSKQKLQTHENTTPVHTLINDFTLHKYCHGRVQRAIVVARYKQLAPLARNKNSKSASPHSGTIMLQIRINLNQPSRRGFKSSKLKRKDRMISGTQVLTRSGLTTPQCRESQARCRAP